MTEESMVTVDTPEIKVALFGVGVMGARIANLILKKKGVRIVCAIDTAPGKVGKDLGNVIGTEESLGVIVSDNPAKALHETKPDIAVHATSSFLKDVFPQLAELVRHGVNVVSTCEELSYPYLSDEGLALELDRLAKENRVAILGTGINPGFLMDALPITLTTVCQEIKSITVERQMNAATRRIPFQKKIGAGLTVEGFRDKIDNHIITGHVGLEQSVAMMASTFGWTLETIKTGTVEPVIAEETVRSEAVEVKKGMVAGLSQTAYGIIDGEPVISLIFKAYIGAKEEYDAVIIEGTPNVHEKISPCIHGDFGTTAVIVNSIPKVLNATPGLKTMKDLPIPSAVLEDMRVYVKR